MRQTASSSWSISDPCVTNPLGTYSIVQKIITIGASAIWSQCPHDFLVTFILSILLWRRLGRQSRLLNEIIEWKDLIELGFDHKLVGRGVELELNFDVLMTELVRSFLFPLEHQHLSGAFNVLIDLSCQCIINKIVFYRNIDLHLLLQNGHLHLQVVIFLLLLSHLHHHLTRLLVHLLHFILELIDIVGFDLHLFF